MLEREGWKCLLHVNRGLQGLLAGFWVRSTSWVGVMQNSREQALYCDQCALPNEAWLLLRQCTCTLKKTPGKLVMHDRGTLCQAQSVPVSWFLLVTNTPPHGQELKQLSGDIRSLLLVPLLPLSRDCFVLSCVVSFPIVHVSWRTSRFSSISLETLACLEERLLTWAFTSIACYLSLSGFAGWLTVVAFASVALLLFCVAFVISYCFLKTMQCNKSGLFRTNRD